MNDALRLVYDYRLLLAMQSEFNLPLDAEQRTRLDALWSMLEGAESPGTMRVMVRFPYPAIVSFTWPGGVSSGELADLSGGGLALRSGERLDEGTRVIVRIPSVDGSCEYVFPTRVVWQKTGSEPTIGLTFEGAPSMLRGSSAPAAFHTAA